MENNKSHGNDGITKEFYCTFWNEIKNIFMNSLRESKLLNALSTSQIKAIIRLIEKLNKGKRFILIGDLFCYLISIKNLYQKR